VAQLFADMAITITCCGVVDVCLTDTRSDAFRVVSQPGRGTADAQGGDYSDRNWFENDRADIGSFSTVAEQARKILLATVGWSLVPDESSAD